MYSFTSFAACSLSSLFMNSLKRPFKIVMRGVSFDTAEYHFTMFLEALSVFNELVDYSSFHGECWHVSLWKSKRCLRSFSNFQNARL